MAGATTEEACFKQAKNHCLLHNGSLYDLWLMQSVRRHARKEQKEHCLFSNGL
jgi:hypothetical protein